MIISIFKEAGDFAEDKDVAARIREGKLKSALASRKKITLDFTGVNLVTQSFVHALIADGLRQNGEPALKRITFKGCKPSIKGIVGTVVQYALESAEEE